MTEGSIRHTSERLPSADEDVARLRLQLRHKPLKELINLGLAKIDEANGVIKKGPKFDQVRSLKK